MSPSSVLDDDAHGVAQAAQVLLVREVVLDVRLALRNHLLEARVQHEPRRREVAEHERDDRADDDHRQPVVEHQPLERVARVRGRSPRASRTTGIVSRSVEAAAMMLSSRCASASAAPRSRRRRRRAGRPARARPSPSVGEAGDRHRRLDGERRERASAVGARARCGRRRRRAASRRPSCARRRPRSRRQARRRPSPTLRRRRRCGRRCRAGRRRAPRCLASATPKKLPL